MDWSEPAKWLLTQGALGLAVLSLGFVVIRLYQACTRSEQGRLQDAKDIIPIIEAQKATWTAQLAAMEARNRQTDKIVEAVQAMDATLQAQIRQNETNLQRAFERLDQLQKAWERHERLRGD